MSENNKQKSNDLDRRELLKGLATVPIFGLFLSQVWRKVRRDRLKKSNILSGLVQEKKSAPAIIKGLSDSKHLNIGIIGYGGRGGHLVRGAGFATTGWTNTVSENARKNKLDKQFKTFMDQEDLNCSLVGVCDLFDVRAEQGLDASQNEVRPGGKPKKTAKRYRHYKDLLADDNIDAVIIATPKPPGQCPTNVVANFTNLNAAPPFNMAIPLNMNNGTAIRTCLVKAPNDT